MNGCWAGEQNHVALRTFDLASVTKMNGVALDIAANRRAHNYSAREHLHRLFWVVGRLLFRLSPRPCFGFRRLILRLFGARVGRHVHIYSSAAIYFPWNLRIDDWSSVGEGAFI